MLSSRDYSPSPECPAWKGGDEWRGEPSDPSARAYGRRAEALAAYSAEVASATKAGKEGKRLRRVPLSISRCPARERGELHLDRVLGKLSLLVPFASKSIRFRALS